MMMMMMVTVTMTVNICDDDCDLVMKIILVKEVMSCDVSPVAMLLDNSIFLNNWWFKDVKNGNPKCPKYSNLRSDLRFGLRSVQRFDFCKVPFTPTNYASDEEK